MQLDVRTFIFILGITHMFQLVVFSYHFWMNRNYDGIGWWLLWSIAEVLGFGFMLLRDIAAIKTIAITGQNTFIILGVICLYIGVLRFFGKKGGLGAAGALFATYFALFSYLIFINDDIIVRGIVICITLAIIAFMTAHALLTYRPSSLAASANFTAVFFLSHGCFFLLRAATLFHNGMPHANLFAPTLLNVASYVDALICCIMWTFALTIMINQRLNVETKEAKDEIELVFNTSPDAAIISRFSDGRIVQVNEGFTILTGFSREEAIDRSSLDLGIWQDPLDRQHMLCDIEKNGTITNWEVRFRKKDGSTYYGLMSAKIINLHDGKHIISLTKDISERKRMEEQIVHMANHDALTGLPTLRLCNDRLAMAIREAGRNKTSVAVMFLDLDNFKSVNDNLGHEAGDHILKEIAQRLHGCVRQTDTVARVGGDEFLIIAPGNNARKSALRIADKIVSRLPQPIVLECQQVEIGTSIGIALYPEDGTEMGQLIKKADEAMYRIKRSGKNSFCFYEETVTHEDSGKAPAEEWADSPAKWRHVYEQHTEYTDRFRGRIMPVHDISSELGSQN